METAIIILVYLFLIGTFAFNTWLSILNYSHRNTAIPEEVNDIYNEDEYKKWLAYSMEVFRFQMIVKVIDFLLFLGMLVFGVFPVFKNISEALFNNPDFAILFFMFLYYIVTLVESIISSYYLQFTIEEKYGFNKSTKKTFITDTIKNFILTVIFIGSLLYGLINLYQNVGMMFYVYGWIFIVVILFGINILYVKLILPLFNKLTPLEEGELKTEIETYSESVGYTVNKIYVMDASKRSTRLNAFFSGFGAFKQVVLYDTLIEKMTTKQIVAVLAHEVGHNKHKHIWKMMLEQVILLAGYFAVLLLLLNVEAFHSAFGFDTVHFGFAIILFSVLMGPIGIVIHLFTATSSRKHEYEADHYAATTYDKESIIGALKVLTKENFSNLTPHPLYVKLTYSHPPVVDRVRAINKIGD